MRVFKLIAFVFLMFEFCIANAQGDAGFGVRYKGQFIGGINAKGMTQYKSPLKKKDATFIVSSRDELLQALSEAKQGDFVYISDGSVIDLSGHKNIPVGAGVTIYGNRGVKKSKGPLIYTDSHGIHPLFDIIGDSVRFFGLRIKGADGTRFYNGKDAFEGKTELEKKDRYLELYRQNMYVTPVSSGIATACNHLIVENCELYQWTYTAIYLKKGARDATVRNCYIHHNQRFGLGYGVTIDESEAFVEGNLFHYNAHDIASTGRKGSSYTAQYNVFKEGFTYSWAVDMHGGKDRGDGTDIAGDYIYVSNNTFYLSDNRQAVVIRGIPIIKCIVKENTVFKLPGSKTPDKRVFEQTNTNGNFDVQNNTIIQK